MVGIFQEMLPKFTIEDEIQFDQIMDKIKDGDGPSLSIIADSYFQRTDFKTARELYHLANLVNNAYSQERLGIIHESGLGVPADYKIALEWYRKSFNNGNVAIGAEIGRLYHFGLGVEKYHATAMYWYKKAANVGNMMAQNNIGVLYEFGDGFNNDIEKALIWYQKSADQGCENAIASIRRLDADGFYLG